MKKILLSIVILSGISFSQVNAQTIKIGYVNSLELLSLMPDIKKADSTLQILATDLQKQYSAYVAEYQSLLSEVQNNATLTEIAREAKIQDLTGLEKRIQEYEQTSQEKINTKKGELYQPILEKATQAVKDTAKENGYTHVFDSSTGAVVYAPDGDNIIGLVKKKLGIL